MSGPADQRKCPKINHNDSENKYLLTKSHGSFREKHSKRKTFIFGMGIWPSSLNTPLSRLYQHVLDAHQGNVTLPFIKDSTAGCSDKHRAAHHRALQHLRHIQKPWLTALAIKGKY